MREHTDFDPYLTGPAKHYRRLALGISTAIQIPPERLAQEAKPRDLIIVQFGMSNAAGLHFHRAWLPRTMLVGGIDIGWAMRGLLRDYPNQPDFQRNKRPSLRHLLYPGVGCAAGLPISVLSRESDYKTPTDRHTIYPELYLGWAPGMQEAAALPELLTPYRTFWEGAPITTSQYSIKEYGDRADIYAPWAETLTIRYRPQCLYHTLIPKSDTYFVEEKRSIYREGCPLYRENYPAFLTDRKRYLDWLRYFNRLGGVTWLPVWDFQLVSDAPEAAVETPPRRADSAANACCPPATRLWPPRISAAPWWPPLGSSTSSVAMGGTSAWPYQRWSWPRAAARWPPSAGGSTGPSCWSRGGMASRAGRL